jgi:hypothetical protein
MPHLSHFLPQQERAHGPKARARGFDGPSVAYDVTVDGSRTCPRTFICH